jgi:REP element-mobilizing transposase RayT
MSNNRKSVRFSKLDYSLANSYFITICTNKSLSIFGEILSESMYLNDCGIIAERYWKEMPRHFKQVEIGEFVIMPNHVHGIINIVDDVKNHNSESNINEFQHIIRSSLGSIVRSYKAAVTRWIHKNSSINDVWQRNYYEHIIANEKDLLQIRDYIIQNPLKWEIEKNEGIRNLW